MSSPTAALLCKDRIWLLSFLTVCTALAGNVFGDHEV